MSAPGTSAVQGTRAPARSVAAAFLAEEKAKLPGFWEEIARAEPGERLAFAARPAFASLPLCDRLRERAFEAAPRSLAEARELASLAARLANRLELRHYPRALARDCRARAALAQALLALAAGDPGEAGSLLLLARVLAGEGSGDAQLVLEAEVAERALAASARDPRPPGRGVARAVRAAEALGEERLVDRLLFLEAWRQARQGTVDPELLAPLEASPGPQLAGALAALRLTHRRGLEDGLAPLAARLADSGDPLAENASLALLALLEIDQGEGRNALGGLLAALCGLVERKLSAAAGSLGVTAATAFARRGEADRLAALLAGFPLDEAFFAGAPRLGFLAQVFTWCAGPERPLGPEALAALGRHVGDTLRAMPAAQPLVMALLAPAKAKQDLEA